MREGVRREGIDRGRNIKTTKRYEDQSVMILLRWQGP
jgi:hypothetical protein